MGTPRIRARPLVSFEHRLELSAHQWEEVSRRNNLDGDRLVDWDHHIPLHAFVGAMEDLGDLTGDRLLGWRLGETLDLAELGDAGLAISLAPSLGDALSCLSDGFATIQTSSYLRFVVDGDVATVKYAILDPNIWPRQQDAELTLGVMAGIVRRFAGDRARETMSLELEHERGAGSRVLGTRVGGAVHHGARMNSLSFPVSLLDKRRSRGPATDFLALSRALDRSTQAVERTLPLSNRVRQLLFQGMDDGGVDQEAVAEALGMSSRTLRRRLMETEGLSFHQIVEDSRKALALAYITRTGLPLGEIALNLGYSDQTAFTRAFSRWFGVSPRAARRGATESSSIT